MNRVSITWERRPAQPTAEPLRRAVRAVLRRLKVVDAEVSVLVTGDERIRELNRRYLERDRPTDVLSFPDGDRLPDGHLLLGEIVVSLDTARRQARTVGHGELDELRELVVHGVLHLVGYDHDADDGEMDSLELELRREVAG